MKGEEYLAGDTVYYNGRLHRVTATNGEIVWLQCEGSYGPGMHYADPSQHSLCYNRSVVRSSHYSLYKVPKSKPTTKVI